VTITLHWWAWPIALLVAGLLAAVYVASKTDRGGNFPDVFTPLVAFGVFLIGLAAALGALIGHFL